MTSDDKLCCLAVGDEPEDLLEYFLSVEQEIIALDGEAPPFVREYIEKVMEERGYKREERVQDIDSVVPNMEQGAAAASHVHQKERSQNAKKEPISQTCPRASRTLPTALDVDTYCEKALALSKIGNHADALKEADLAVKQYPHSSRAFEVRGRVIEEWKGSPVACHELAAKDYFKAYILDTNNVWVKERLAKSISVLATKQFKNKDYKAACESAKKCLAIKPDHKNASDLLLYMKAKGLIS